MSENFFNNFEHLESLVALYEERLDCDERKKIINQMAQNQDLRKLYSEFVISNRDDDAYAKKLLEIKLGLIIDYDIYSDPSHRQKVHQITKNIIEKMEKENLEIADNLIDPLINMTVENKYAQREVCDYAMGAGGLESFIYLIVPVVVQMISIIEFNQPDNLKEIIPVLIKNVINQSDFQEKRSWLRTPILKHKMKKLPDLIQKAVENFLDKKA